MKENVRTYLIELARNRTNQTVNYQKLSDDCELGLNMQDGIHIRKQMGDILRDISEFEFKCHRPLLSALVIRLNDGEEGDGFYKMAAKLGFGNGNWKKLKTDFFEYDQMNECIEKWSNDEFYNKNK